MVTGGETEPRPGPTKERTVESGVGAGAAVGAPANRATSAADATATVRAARPAAVRAAAVGAAVKAAVKTAAWRRRRRNRASECSATPQVRQDTAQAGHGTCRTRPTQDPQDTPRRAKRKEGGRGRPHLARYRQELDRQELDRKELDGRNLLARNLIGKNLVVMAIRWSATNNTGGKANRDQTLPRNEREAQNEGKESKPRTKTNEQKQTNKEQTQLRTRTRGESQPKPGSTNEREKSQPRPVRVMALAHVVLQAPAEPESIHLRPKQQPRHEQDAGPHRHHQERLERRCGRSRNRPKDHAIQIKKGKTANQQSSLDLI